MANRKSMSRITLLGVLFLCGLSNAHGQLFSFGIKAGVPLTDAYSTVNSGEFNASAYKRFLTVGPTVELHLPFHLSIEADTLYRRNGFSTTSAIIASPTVSTAVNDWQFPILAKADLGAGLVHPFIDGGLVYRRISVSNFTLANANTAGVAFGAGLKFKLLAVKISPEIRYTYWPKGQSRCEQHHKQ